MNEQTTQFLTRASCHAPRSHIQTDMRTDMQIDMQTGMQTDTQTDMQTDMPTDKQTDMQTMAAVSMECVVSGIHAQNPAKQTGSAQWTLAIATADRYTHAHEHMHACTHTHRTDSSWMGRPGPIPEKTEST